MNRVQAWFRHVKVCNKCFGWIMNLKFVGQRKELAPCTKGKRLFDLQKEETDVP